MKLSIVLTMVFLTTAALANERIKGQSLQDKKANLISRLDKRIVELQKSKACIQEAKDEKAVSECHQGQRNRRERLRKKLEGHRNQNQKEQASE